MRVAIVEDDPSQAELLTHWLELAGHRCHHFDRGEALIRSLDQESFDMLVLDWNLPDISGVDVLKRIRSSQQSALPDPVRHRPKSRGRCGDSVAPRCG